MATKSAKAPKTKTTAQRVATVRKNILADIRALDKARRTVERNLDALHASVELGTTTFDNETHTQLVKAYNTLLTTIEVLNGAMNEKAAKLVGTYTAR